MKRCLFKLTLFLLLGAIVNVAVAWGCAFWSRFAYSETKTSNISQLDEQWLRTNGCWYEDTTTWRYTFQVQKSSGIGVTEHIFTSLQDTQPELKYSFFSTVDSRKKSLNAVHVFTGWPLHTLSGERWRTERTGLDYDPIWLENDCPPTVLPRLGQRYSINQGSSEPEQRRYLLEVPADYGVGALQFNRSRYLPLKPLWFGFMINLVFYALVLWLITLAALTVRRLIRNRRGRCIKCGYDLRGDISQGCPECGWGRKK